jgi:peptide-methionine (S)-S-oxide reductase
MKIKSTEMINWVIGTLVSVFSFSSCAEHKSQDNIMSDDRTMQANIKTDTATFATGCFWCTEAIFQRVKGVIKVTSGYSGGHVANPTYEEVCTGTTGHAESCEVVYDPQQISYDGLLKIFWKTHDPTTLNRQGNDVGTQYRSVVFYHNEYQKERAEYYKHEIDSAKIYPNPIVTAIEPFSNFYSAEQYHQDYYNSNPNQMYCRLVILPKVEKFESLFKDELKPGMAAH